MTGLARLRSTYDRDIARLAVPALGALAAEPLYVLADTAVVGHLGTTSLAGLAIASSVLLIGFNLCIFLAYGTTSAVARLLGAGEHDEAAHQAVQGLWLAFGIGLGVAALGAVLGEPLLRLLGAEGEVLEQASIYLRISLLGVPGMLLVFAGTGYLRGLQDTRTPLVVAIVSATANLVIELVLIYGFDFGIGASAFSTVVAQWGAAAVYLWRVGGDVHRLGVPLAPHLGTLRTQMTVARALFVRTAALRGSLVLATAVAARRGPVELAAYQIGYEIWNFLALSLDAVAIAAQAMIGRLLGAKEPGEARAAANRMIEWGVAGGVLFGVVVIAFRGVIPGLFTDDPEVIAVAARLLVLVALLEPVAGIVFVLDGVLIGAGDLRYLARAMVVAFVVFVPAALVVLFADLPVGWLWAAIALMVGTRAVTLVRRYRTPAWQTV